jgi:sugar (pentulose or hexulose) kinase
MSGIALGLDIGTGGVRAAVLDAAGATLAFAAAPFPGGRARAPEGWWAGVEAALAALHMKANLGTVTAVAVDGTSGTLVAVDGTGMPLGGGSLYNDRAPPEMVEAVRSAAPPDSAALGGSSPLARALALRATPGLARLLHQADWVAGRLRGAFDATDENNALKTGYDPLARRWPDWIARAGLDPALLPPLVAEPGAPLGPIDAAVAARLGLPRGVVVAAGTTDGCAAFLATSAAEPGEAVTSLGSTLVLKLACGRPVSDPASGVYSHRLGAVWLAGGASNTGGAALARHFDPAALAALSARIDPSRDSGLDYYPLPAPGERFPVSDPGLAPRETPRPEDDARFLHGLLEGIARVEAAGYARLAALGAPRPRSIRTVGGGARNAAWSGIRARLLGVPLVPAASEEAAVGTARLALRAAQGG